MIRLKREGFRPDRDIIVALTADESTTMTRPWNEIVAHYEDYDAEQRSIRALKSVTRRINESQLGRALFAWTSMFDLCIVQTDVSYPYDGPYLRLSPVSDHQVEFRYLDIHDKAQQWHRSVEAEDILPRLLKFLDQLRWFPAEVLESMSSDHQAW